MRTAFEREGDIRSVDLLAAFATLWRERSSGVLRLSAPGESIRFDVVRGEVASVSASDPSFDSIEVLLRAGKLDATQLEERRLPSGRDRAAAAREMGLLTERDWRWGERIRAVEILAHLVGWLEGSYAFDSSARPGAGELNIGIHRLILELFLRSRDRAFVHHALPAVDARLQRAADFEEQFGTLGLTPDALAVAAAIDGRSTAAEISRRTPPDPFSVEKLLAALATLGLLHPEYAAEPAHATPRLDKEKDLEAAPESEPVGSDVVEEPAEPRIDRPEPEIDLPLATPVEPSEPEPALVGWENAPPEPMDQRLDVAGAELSSPPRRSLPAAVWVLLVLAVAVGALLVSRARETGTGPPAPAPSLPIALPETPPAVATPAPPTSTPAPFIPTAVPNAVPSAIPSAIPTPAPATPAPSPPPLPSATAVRPTTAPHTPVATPPPVPTPRVVPTPPAALPAPSPRPTAAASVATRAEWLTLGERHRRLLERQPSALFTIQLELVCELPSLTDAWRFDRGGEMWLAPAEHRGRPCFRVFWGRYAELDEARRARASVPRFFFTPTNHPVVVSTRAALLP